MVSAPFSKVRRTPTEKMGAVAFASADSIRPQAGNACQLDLAARLLNV